MIFFEIVRVSIIELLDENSIRIFDDRELLFSTQTFIVTSNFEFNFSNSNALFDDFSRVCFFIVFNWINVIFFRRFRCSKRVQTFDSIRDRRNLFIIVWKKYCRNRDRRFLFEKKLKKKNTIRETRKSLYFLTKTYNNKFKRNKIIKSFERLWCKRDVFSIFCFFFRVSYKIRC